MPIGEFLGTYADVLLAAGWLLVVFFVLWLAWETYKIIKRIDYVSGIEWSFLQITVPPDNTQTPRAMENVYEVLNGIHKGSDFIEKYFEGYLEAWYSCELHCTKGRARYIMVVPAAHRRFFEGAIYGNYPTAEIREVEDYTLRYDYKDIDEKFDLWGAEVHLAEDDILPIRTYRDFEDTLSEEEKYVDPHQALIEAYTNIDEGEEFWLQIQVRPLDAGDKAAWTQSGEQRIAEISGQAAAKPASFTEKFMAGITKVPSEIFGAFLGRAIEPESQKDELQLRFFNPADDAKMKGILLKTSKPSFRVKIRIIYISPPGKLNKPNIGKAFGVFKQFDTYNLNNFKPDPNTKTNGPNYILKQYRRSILKRNILLNYQWRDMFMYTDGQMFNAEELASLYHFPVMYLKAPGVEHAKSGLSSAPDDVPYV